MKSETLSLKTNLNKLDSLKKAVIIQWNTWKKYLLLFAKKLIEKIPDPRNAKEHCQSFIRKKNKKSVKHQVYTNNIVFTLKWDFLIQIYLLLSFFFFLLFFHICKIILFCYFLCFPMYNNVYPNYCHSCEKDVSQWNQKIYLWKIL